MTVAASALPPPAHRDADLDDDLARRRAAVDSRAAAASAALVQLRDERSTAHHALDVARVRTLDARIEAAEKEIRAANDERTAIAAEQRARLEDRIAAEQSRLDTLRAASRARRRTLATFALAVRHMETEARVAAEAIGAKEDAIAHLARQLGRNAPPARRPGTAISELHHSLARIDSAIAEAAGTRRTRLLGLLPGGKPTDEDRALARKLLGQLSAEGPSEALIAARGALALAEEAAEAADEAQHVALNAPGLPSRGRAEALAEASSAAERARAEVKKAAHRVREIEEDERQVPARSAAIRLVAAAHDAFEKFASIVNL